MFPRALMLNTYVFLPTCTEDNWLPHFGMWFYLSKKKKKSHLNKIKTTEIWFISERIWLVKGYDLKFRLFEWYCNWVWETTHGCFSNFERYWNRKHKYIKLIGLKSHNKLTVQRTISQISQFLFHTWAQTHRVSSTKIELSHSNVTKFKIILKPSTLVPTVYSPLIFNCFDFPRSS